MRKVDWVITEELNKDTITAFAKELAITLTENKKYLNFLIEKYSAGNSELEAILEFKTSKGLSFMLCNIFFGPAGKDITINESQNILNLLAAEAKKYMHK